MTLVTNVLVKFFFIIDSVLASGVNTANLTDSGTNTASLTTKGESLVQNLDTVEAVFEKLLLCSPYWCKQSGSCYETYYL